MRISDWSSDVCSSDLPDEARIDPRGAAGDRAVAAARGRRQHRIAEQKDIGRIDLKAAGGGIAGAARAPRSAAIVASRLSADARRVVGELCARGKREAIAGDEIELPEIGRASCRERVCQYV